MGVHLELVNFNALYQRSSRQFPKIINDLSDSTEDDKENVKNLIYSRYQSTDLMSNNPSCECGVTHDAVNIGITCRNCHTQVKIPSEHNLEPIIWMRRPKGVAPLMNPDLFTILCSHFKVNGFDLIRYLSDVAYKPDTKIPPVVDQIMAQGIRRGYSFFVENFNHVLNVLFATKKNAKAMNLGLQQLILENPNSIFSDYLPLPNRSLLVIEETNLGRYVDETITGAIDAIQTIVNIDSPLNDYSLREKENRTIKVIALLANFYEEYKSANLAKKEGAYRKHAFGSRAHWSFRAVVSSLTDAHHHDEIHVPWGVAMGVFHNHLQSKLFDRGLSYKESKSFLYAYTQRTNPILIEIFNELIEECPYMGVPCVLQRNPSLMRGSAQLKFITKVKTDMTDRTIGMSILSVVPFNADFDGRCLPSQNSFNCWKPFRVQ